MIVATCFSDYEILDTGDGMKLERWGDYILSRPDPQIIWGKQMPERWVSADAVYMRSTSGGGEWKYHNPLPDRWTLSYKNLRFYVRPTGFKHTGLFPEQCANWDFVSKNLDSNDQVLNLFAYTGGATMACAAAGATVVHVDAAKSMNSWAKENAALCGLSAKPIRYITDDCLKFVLREQRRNNRYDGIIMDPPSYGRGTDGSVWKLEDNLFQLIQEAVKLLSIDPKFFIISSYTTGLSSVVTSNMIKFFIPGGTVEAGDLVLPTANENIYLPCGTTARWKA